MRSYWKAEIAGFSAVAPPTLSDAAGMRQVEQTRVLTSTMDHFYWAAMKGLKRRADQQHSSSAGATSRACQLHLRRCPPCNQSYDAATRQLVLRSRCRPPATTFSPAAARSFTSLRAIWPSAPAIKVCLGGGGRGTEQVDKQDNPVDKQEGLRSNVCSLPFFYLKLTSKRDSE